jgi:hypothetical protein
VGFHETFTITLLSQIRFAEGTSREMFGYSGGKHKRP